MINPEMIFAKLFTECLGDDEALTMIGCEQFNSYTGYAGSFRWAGDFRDATPLDMYRRRKCRVVAIDAIFYKSSYEQFKEETFRRERTKRSLASPRMMGTTRRRWRRVFGVAEPSTVTRSDPR